MIGLTYFIYFIVSWFVLTILDVITTKHRAKYNMAKLTWLSAVMMIAPAIIIPIVSWFHNWMFVAYAVVLFTTDFYITPKLLPWALKDWQHKTKMLLCLHK